MDRVETRIKELDRRHEVGAGVRLIQSPPIMSDVLVPAVNFHLWAPCNMKCRFCFAPFHDVRRELPKGHLPRGQAIRVARALGEAFDKVTFVGGEPLLCPWLGELLEAAKEAGAVTSVVTNGARLTARWMDETAGLVDWIGLSIDSGSEETHRELGRAARGTALPNAHYAAVAGGARERGIRLKVNTVVTSATQDENMTALIERLHPERWKVFQMMPVAGQNDGSEDLRVSDRAFGEFVERHRSVEASGVTLVAEPNRLMRGSYAMVDPAGRFFDSSGGGHRYGRPVLDVGIAAALGDVQVDAERFEVRGGAYEWRSSTEHVSG